MWAKIFGERVEGDDAAGVRRSFAWGEGGERGERGDVSGGETVTKERGGETVAMESGADWEAGEGGPVIG